MNIPDAYRDDNDEWVYPQIYYAHNKRITKANLIKQINKDPHIQEAIKIEPQIKTLLERVKKERCVLGYNQINTFYHSYKPVIERLVGWNSPHPPLRETTYYDAVYDVVYHLLPADDTELYPEGIMGNEMYSPALQEKYGREYP